MTRINSGIPVECLTDQHLLAEHREIKRVVRRKPTNVPPKFTLGKGHEKFFGDKHIYTYKRYVLIYDECKRRGFNIQFYGDNWDLNGSNDWEETEEARNLIVDRIKERLYTSTIQWRYRGNKVTPTEAFRLLINEPCYT